MHGSPAIDASAPAHPSANQSTPPPLAGPRRHRSALSISSGLTARATKCLHCGYPFAGLEQDAPCPECGTMFGPAPVVTHCIQCGYSLEALGDDALCPECATPVQRSRFGFHFAHAGDDYTDTVVRGLGLVTKGALLLIVAFVAGVLVSRFIAGMGFASIVPRLATPVPIAMILWGYTLMVTPDPGLGEREQPGRARACVRAGVGVCAAAAFVNLLTAGVGPRLGIAGSGAVVAIVLAVLSLVGPVLVFFASTRYVAWLASRIPDPKLTRRAKRTLWLLPLWVLLPTLVSVLAGGAGRGAGAMSSLRTLTMLAACTSLVAWLSAPIIVWNLFDAVRKGILGARAKWTARRRPSGGSR
jgi:predicted Zn-ribbon and HTH transcriptional regulator